MANTINTVDALAKEFLDIFHDELTFITSVNNQYDDQWAKEDGAGYKKGSSIRISAPWQPVIGDGATASAQDFTESTITLTIDKHKHAMVAFGAQEQSMELTDMANRILKPAASRLASDLEVDALSVIIGASQTIIAATPAAMAYTDCLEAKTLLDEFTAPGNDRTFLASPRSMKGILADTKSLYNSQDAIGNQYVEGYVKTMNGMDFLATNRIGNITIPADIAGVTVAADYVAGATTIALQGLTDTQVIQAGTTFSTALCNKLGPETKADLGTAWQFTVLADVTVAAGGLATVTVAPVTAAIDGSEMVSALPLDDAAVTFLGIAGKTYRQAIAYQKDAFTVSFAPLAKLDGAENSRKDFEGVGISVTKDSNILTLQNICRIDTIYGYLTLRGQYAVRVLEQVD